MERRFDTAIEASKILDDLRKQLKTINYNKDLHKLFRNTEKLVGTLGSIEVKARQSHKPSLVDETRNELANSIDYLEKLLLIARLSE